MIKNEITVTCRRCGKFEVETKDVDPVEASISHTRVTLPAMGYDQYYTLRVNAFSGTALDLSPEREDRHVLCRDCLTAFRYFLLGAAVEKATRLYE